MNSRVEDVMTRDVMTVQDTARYKDVIAVMRRWRISAVPVLDAAGDLVGLVSEADLLLKQVERDAMARCLISTGRRGELVKAAGVTAAELMSSPVVTIGSAESLAAAARLMHESRVKRLPVVDDSGRLAGIVSRMDVLSVFVRTDHDIRTELAKIIATDFALDPGAFDVNVRSGIVTITGRVESRAVVRRLADALRHVEGVVDVCGQISSPEPQLPGA